jgi:hypothetical protein
MDATNEITVSLLPPSIGCPGPWRQDTAHLTSMYSMASQLGRSNGLMQRLLGSIYVLNGSGKLWCLRFEADAKVPRPVILA